MDIKDQIRITEELLEGVKELNGEYQEGWENNILEAENLIKHLKQVKSSLGDVMFSLPKCKKCNDLRAVPSHGTFIPCDCNETD